MKQKVSISLDKAVIEEIDKKLIDGLFRNRSHFIEYNIKKAIEGEKR